MDRLPKVEECERPKCQNFLYFYKQAFYYMIFDERRKASSIDRMKTVSC